MLTLLNPNLDSSGYSDDNFLQHELDMSAKLALVRNSPKLVGLNADSRVQITSIYRAAGDGNFSQDAVKFVTDRHNAAPQAAYIHLTNEAGLPPEIGPWTLTAAVAAEALGVKVAYFGCATNTDVAMLRAHEATILDLNRRGHKFSIHLYLDGIHDAGGYAPLDYLKSIGADCFITEYGYIKSIEHDGEGYRGVLVEDDSQNIHQYCDWLDSHAAKLASYGWPAFLFSIDQWPASAEGKAKGFGTEDRPTIHKRSAAINIKYPFQDTAHVIPPPSGPGVRATLTKIPLDWINLRAQPNGADVGDLVVGNDCLTWPNAKQGEWMYVVRVDGRKGWTSLQGGAVVFTPTAAAVRQIIDVSEAQGSVQWSQVKAAGIDTVIVRATQGTKQVDQQFAANMAGAEGAGLHLGVYHALIASANGKAQADNFLAVTRAYLNWLDLPLAIDVELSNGMTPTQVADTLYAMAVALEGATGAKPMIYTSPGFWNGSVGKQHDPYFAQCPLWVAHWTTASKPLLPRCWTTYRFWQYANDGNVSGIAGRVDLSRPS